MNKPEIVKSGMGSLTRRICSAVLAVGLGSSAYIAMAPVAQAEVPQVRKVALVDLQRVLNETKQGKNARAELEKSSTAKQKQLDEKRKKLEADQVKVQELTGEAQEKAAQKLQQDFQELQGIYMALQQELAGQESRLLSQIYDNCQKLVGGMAQQMTVDLVLVRDQNTVLYTQDALDITNTIIGQYDKKHPK